MSIPWNETNAAHLYRRAAFGGTPAEIAQATGQGLTGAVDFLVNYQGISNAAMDQKITALGLDLTTTQGIARWFIARMIYSARPLEERMTWFWHDHWATAISKVQDQEYMLRQNKLMRSYAVGNFAKFALDMSKDPAMLIWLDNRSSVKEHPNENYGRELLELFTLGQGHYSELDVASSARAFTGWGLDRQTRMFIFRSTQHDYSSKDFLGRVGTLDGGDIISIATGEFAHAQLIAAKAFSYFAYEYPEQDVVDRFAQIYLDGKTEIKPLVRAILTSDEMYSSKAIWGRVKSPIDHTIMSTRQLLIDSDARAASGTLSVQGEYPFNPPDVSGWPTGLTWINSGTLLSRMNYANTLLTGFDPVKFAAGVTVTTAAALVDLYLTRLGPLPVDANTRTRLISYVSADGSLPAGAALTAKQRGLVHMILSLPDWQLN
ncbi:MAG TPA: DUF1800 domain-containing protein [Thermoanaerobaculia bacterium]|nr:DUF1800 domain-containing protein [Thermoanaerobaculia bacterium]